jgi:outer membrane immunogenic protein
MRYLVALAFSLGLAASQAVAADLGRAPARPMAPVAVAPLWTGFYAGIHGGYGWGDIGGSDLSGGFAGGQLGYNIQNGNIVWGVEVDSAWSGMGRTDTLSLGGVTATGDTDVNYIGSARGRVGYAAGNGLYYVTGGAAWARGDVQVTVAAPGFVAGTSASNTHFGWTIGAGGEWMIQPNWSVKIEYLYADYGSESYFGVPVDLQVNTIKVGLNYLFR